MKKIFLAILTALIFVSCASIFTYMKGEELTYVKVSDHKLLRQDAHNVAFTWIAKNFNSANDVIQMNDAENGKLILQAMGYFTVGLGTKLYWRYTLTIKNKDNKVQYTFDTGNVETTNLPPHIDYKDDVYKHYDSIIRSLDEALLKGVADEDNF